MSKSASRKPAAAPKAAALAPKSKAAAPAANKRKRAPEPESEDDEEDAAMLDAMVGGGSDDDDDEEDADDIEIDPQEIAAMAHLYGKQSRRPSAADEDDDEDAGQDGESSEDDGEEATDEGTGQIARPAKKKVKLTFLNNKVAMLDKLQEMKLPATFPWIESLQLTTKKSFLQATGEAKDAVHDDLKREAALSVGDMRAPRARHRRASLVQLPAVADALSPIVFLFSACSYELSLNSASEGLQQLTDLSIPFRIPPDFFAERLKADKHMARIKDKLIEEKQKMVSVSERKLHKESQRFGKKVQSAKLQEKSAEKKANLAAAGRMRKSDDQELGVERSILPGVAAHLAANKADESARREKKSAKRDAKDKKYGNGGKKRNVRKNDKESVAAGKDYAAGNMRKNFAGFKDSKPGSVAQRQASRGWPAARRPPLAHSSLYMPLPLPLQFVPGASFFFEQVDHLESQWFDLHSEWSRRSRRPRRRRGRAWRRTRWTRRKQAEPTGKVVARVIEEVSRPQCVRRKPFVYRFHTQQSSKLEHFDQCMF